MAILPITSLLTGSSSPFLATGDVLVFVDVSDLTQSVNGSTVKATVTQFFAQLPVPVAILSASATAFAVGRLGATTPGFLVDASTATCVTGLKITPAAAAAGVALVVISSGTNESLTFNAKGTGGITFQSVATGGVGFATDFGPTQTVNVTFASNIATFNWALGNSQYHPTTLTANASITMTNSSNGRIYRGMIFNPGGYTLTFTDTVRWLGTAFPAQTWTTGKAVTFQIWYLGTTAFGQWQQEA